jgi:hypothetical protein
MKKTMIDFYNARAYTHRYIFGVSYKGTVYAVKADSDVLPYVLTLDKASRGAGSALKFKPNNDQRLMLIAMGAQVVCSTAELEAQFASSKYNRGEIFEKLVTELNGQVWEKDNIPFTDAGDIEIDGIAYQIKYEKASFINEAQMLRLRAE